MRGKLAGLKDIFWAIGIVICLMAVLVGFIFAAASRFNGVREDFHAPSDTGNILDMPAAGVLNKLKKTSDAGQEYIDSLIFLCDSSMIGLRDYSLLGSNQVWGSSAGNIPANTLGTCTIRYPNDGSEISPSNAAMVSKPSVLVISVGCDGLFNVSREEFIDAYTSLIAGIRSSSPDTRMICCSLTSVTEDYSGADGLSVELVSEANDWIKQVCTDTGVFFCDCASEITTSGYLLNQYASSNGKTLNSDGLNVILEYLRTHALR